MKILTVLPLKKGLHRDGLTYFSAKEIPNGSIVRVPIRKQSMLALVIDSKDATGLKADIKESDFGMRKVLEVLGPSFFSRDFLASAEITAKYFACGTGEVLRTLTPETITENYEKLSTETSTQYIGEKIKNLKPEKLIFQSPAEDRMSFYKTFIRESFARSKSVFFILPSIAEIEAFALNLSPGIEKYCLTLHSSMPAKKILSNWNTALTETHGVVIFATAPFLSLPKTDIGAIVVEHENSNAYKNIQSPKIDFRNFAEIFAFQSGTKIIFADSMLSVETIERYRRGALGEVAPPSFRLDSQTEKRIVDMRPETKEDGSKKKFKVISDELAAEIKNVVGSGGKMFLFALRKGFAPQTICRDCGSIVFCENCHAPMVLYGGEKKNEREFKCPKCNLKKDAALLCATCGSWNLAALGIGIERVAEDLENMVDKKKIFRLDRDQAKTKKETLKIINDFEKEKGAVLVGTEYALGFLTGSVESVAVVSFDSLFSIPDFRMNEKIIRLLCSLESFADKKILIQTRNPEEKVLEYFASGVMLAFYREEIESRQKFNYPPFSTFIKVAFRGSEKETEPAKAFMVEHFAPWEPSIFPSFRSKIDKKIITNMLIRLPRENWSIPELCGTGTIDTSLRERLLALPPSFKVEVDPENLL